MKTHVQFIGFSGFLHHFEFVDEMLAHIKKFEHVKEFRTNAIVRRHNNKHEFSPERFECELLIHGDRLRGDMFIKKSSYDFYESVKAAFAAAEKILRKESKTRATRRRRQHQSVQHMVHQHMETDQAA